MSKKGYLGNGQRVHLVIRGVGAYAYTACGAEGIFWSTSDSPVDCKACLRHMAKAEELEAK